MAPRRAACPARRRGALPFPSRDRACAGRFVRRAVVHARGGLMLKHVVLVLGLLLPMLLLPVTVAAGRTATLDLVSERWTTYAPTQCYHEDSLHERAWAGTLAA